MHIDYTAIITFCLGILLPWIRRQLIQTMQWIIFGRITDEANKLIDDITAKYKAKHDKTIK